MSHAPCTHCAEEDWNTEFETVRACVRVDRVVPAALDMSQKPRCRLGLGKRRSPLSPPLSTFPCLLATPQAALPPYFKAKTLAEWEAWAMVSQQDRWSLVTICPVVVMGPPMAANQQSGECVCVCGGVRLRGVCGWVGG